MARPTGQTLTPDQIAALIRKHFPADMSEEDVRIGIAIVYAESGGNPTLVYDKNRNGSIDRGLWQINSVHKPDLARIFDPEYNTEMAAGVYTRAGRKWTPWSAYKNGKYREHMTKAARANIPAASPAQNANPIAGAAGGVLGGGIASAAADLANPFGGAFDSVAAAAMRIYASAIMYLIALVLFVIGVVIILRNPALKVAGALPVKGAAGKVLKAVT